jgi:hypothetical protein
MIKKTKNYRGGAKEPKTKKTGKSGKSGAPPGATESKPLPGTTQVTGPPKGASVKTSTGAPGTKAGEVAQEAKKKKKEKAEAQEAKKTKSAEAQKAKKEKSGKASANASDSGKKTGSATSTAPASAAPAPAVTPTKGAPPTPPKSGLAGVTSLEKVGQSPEQTKTEEAKAKNASDALGLKPKVTANTLGNPKAPAAPAPAAPAIADPRKLNKTSVTTTTPEKTAEGAPKTNTPEKTADGADGAPKTKKEKKEAKRHQVRTRQLYKIQEAEKKQQAIDQKLLNSGKAPSKWQSIKKGWHLTKQAARAYKIYRHSSRAEKKQIRRGEETEGVKKAAVAVARGETGAPVPKPQKAKKVAPTEAPAAPPKEGASPAPPKEGASPAPPKEGASPAPPKEGASPAPPKEGAPAAPPKEGAPATPPKEGAPASGEPVKSKRQQKREAKAAAQAPANTGTVKLSGTHTNKSSSTNGPEKPLEGAPKPGLADPGKLNKTSVTTTTPEKTGTDQDKGVAQEKGAAPVAPANKPKKTKSLVKELEKTKKKASESKDKITLIDAKLMDPKTSKATRAKLVMDRARHVATISSASDKITASADIIKQRNDAKLKVIETSPQVVRMKKQLAKKLGVHSNTITLKDVVDANPGFKQAPEITKLTTRKNNSNSFSKSISNIKISEPPKAVKPLTFWQAKSTKRSLKSEQSSKEKTQATIAKLEETILKKNLPEGHPKRVELEAQQKILADTQEKITTIEGKIIASHEATKTLSEAKLKAVGVKTQKYGTKQKYINKTAKHTGRISNSEAKLTKMGIKIPEATVEKTNASVPGKTDPPPAYVKTEVAPAYTEKTVPQATTGQGKSDPAPAYVEKSVNNKSSSAYTQPKTDATTAAPQSKRAARRERREKREAAAAAASTANTGPVKTNVSATPTKEAESAPRVRTEATANAEKVKTNVSASPTKELGGDQSKTTNAVPPKEGASASTPSGQTREEKLVKMKERPKPTADPASPASPPKEVSSSTAPAVPPRPSKVTPDSAPAKVTPAESAPAKVAPSGPSVKQRVKTIEGQSTAASAAG